MGGEGKARGRIDNHMVSKRNDTTRKINIEGKVIYNRNARWKNFILYFSLIYVRLYLLESHLWPGHFCVHPSVQFFSSISPS